MQALKVLTRPRRIRARLSPRCGGSEGPLKILIADDHVAIREGVKLFLKDLPGEVVFGDAVDGYDALEKAKSTRWDLVILDLKMPAVEGFIVLKLLKQWDPDLPVLIYSVYSERQFAKHLLRLGADGYLSKEADPQKLLAEVQMILHRSQGRRALRDSPRRLPEDLAPAADPESS